MNSLLPQLIFIAGIVQLSILIASAQIPFQLNWKQELAVLPRLHRQLYFIYGGYVVLSITSLGLISIFQATELAAGSGLARAFCSYVCLFWGIRLSLQLILDARPFLKTWWLTMGYHTLSVLFAALTILNGYAALIG